MGRWRGQQSAQSHKQYHHELNGEVEQAFFNSAATRHDVEKAWFHASCKNDLHVCYRTLDAANDPERRALRCRVCSKQVKKKPSEHERKLYGLLESMGLEFATEVLVFPSFIDKGSSGFRVSCHPTDVLLAKSGLLIEVDGEQHFEGEYKKQGWEEQQERDREVDAAAIEVGYGCIRLHYQDAAVAWEATIKRAIELQQDPQILNKGFIMYSPGYKKPPTL